MMRSGSTKASALTLAFVARRLLAEPVAIVFATREPAEELVVSGRDGPYAGFIFVDAHRAHPDGVGGAAARAYALRGGYLDNEDRQPHERRASRSTLRFM